MWKQKGLATRLMLLLRGEQLAREVEDVLRRGGCVVASAAAAARTRGHVGEGSQLRHGRRSRHRPVVCGDN